MRRFKRIWQLAVVVMFLGGGMAYYQYLYPHSRNLNVFISNHAGERFHSVDCLLLVKSGGETTVKSRFYFNGSIVTGGGSAGVPMGKTVPGVKLPTGEIQVEVVISIKPTEGAPTMRRVFRRTIELNADEDIFLTLDMVTGFGS